MPDNIITRDEKKEIRKSYSFSGTTLLIFLVVYFFLAKPIVNAAASLFITEADYNTFVTIGSIVLIIIAEISAILLGSKFCGINLRSLFNIGGFSGKTIAKSYFAAQGLGYIASFFISLIIVFFTLFANLSPGTFTPNIVERMNESGLVPAFTAFYAIIFAPFLEELLFRGIILGSLSRYNRTFAIIISAIAFGFTHGNIQQACYSMIAGIVFAAVDLRYNSIIPSIISHSFINIFGMISSFFMKATGYSETAEKMLSMTNPFEMIKLITPQMIVVMLILFAVITAFIITAIVIVIKNKNRFREFFIPVTEWNKSRALPILLTSIPWILCFAVLIYEVFIRPFWTFI
ncbi:MAG: CPBP family intramembrane metalloprotease [Ruminococcus sp.]|jgi:membrane protease YdiL (CAAX protease family)|nr:CPBP family intramembrane metalloprotease [Ruminococcus sp.]